MTAFGTMVTVTTAAEYERLLVMPTSMKGWFDPTANNRRGYGEVWFTSVQAAAYARLIS